jgi:hypothetical protein
MDLKKLVSEIKLEEERLSIRVPEIIMEKLKVKAADNNKSITDEVISLMINNYGWEFLFGRILSSEELQNGIRGYIGNFRDPFSRQMLHLRLSSSQSDNDRAEELVNEILNFIFVDSDRILLRKLRKIINLDNKYFIKLVHEINETIK